MTGERKLWPVKPSSFDPYRPVFMKNGTPVRNLVWLGPPHNTWRGLTPDGHPWLWHDVDGRRDDDQYSLTNAASIVADHNARAEPAASDRQMWRPIATAPLSRDDNHGKFPGVMLIARYPSSDQWTDPVLGWWIAADGSLPSEWCRWPHAFPPTHWMPELGNPDRAAPIAAPAKPFDVSVATRDVLAERVPISGVASMTSVRVPILLLAACLSTIFGWPVDLFRAWVRAAFGPAPVVTYRGTPQQLRKGR